ncbi:MAG TPA: hypothetical protein VJC03_00605, partial [bacterium]|nr:hypothetical protein [bacterium]
MIDKNKDLSEFEEEEFEEEGMEDPDSEPDAGGEDFLDEEDDLGGEEWDDDEFDSEELTAKPKKVLNFNTMVIGIGVVIALGMFLMQVTKSDNNKSAEKLVDPPIKGIGMAGTRDSVVYQGIEKKEEKEPDEKKSGILSSLDSSEDLPDYQPRRTVPAEVENPPQPKPFSQQTQAPASLPKEEAAPSETAGAISRDEDPLMPMPDLAEAPENLETLPSLGSEDQIPEDMASEKAPEGEQTIMAPVMPDIGLTSPDTEEKIEITAVPVQRKDTDTAQTGDLAKIASQLESISKRLDTLESKINSDSVNSELAALKKAVSQLEGGLKNQKATIPAKASSTSADKKATDSASSRSASIDITAKPAPIRKQALPAAAVKWELRAAQPGRAWVAKAGSSEMQMVD